MLPAIVIIVFVLAAVLDWGPLLKAKKTKECLLYGVLIAVSFAVLLLGSLEINVRSLLGMGA